MFSSWSVLFGCHFFDLYPILMNLFANEHKLVLVSDAYVQYGKLASGAESHYEICCSFPQIVRTLHALESSISIQFLFRLLRSSDLEFWTTLTFMLIRYYSTKFS